VGFNQVINLLKGSANSLWKLGVIGIGNFGKFNLGSLGIKNRPFGRWREGLIKKGKGKVWLLI